MYIGPATKGRSDKTTCNQVDDKNYDDDDDAVLATRGIPVIMVMLIKITVISVEVITTLMITTVIMMIIVIIGMVRTPFPSLNTITTMMTMITNDNCYDDHLSLFNVP